MKNSACFQKHEDAQSDIKNIATSTVSKSMKVCLKEVTFMVNDQDRDRVVKISCKLGLCT
jgi:hypothetical protein